MFLVNLFGVAQQKRAALQILSSHFVVVSKGRAFRSKCVVCFLHRFEKVEFVGSVENVAL